MAARSRRGFHGCGWWLGVVVVRLARLVSPRTVKLKKEDSELFVRVNTYWCTNKYLQCWMLNTYFLFFDVELLCFLVGPINLEPNTRRRIWYTMRCCDALSCVTMLLAASGLTFRSCMPNGGISFGAHSTLLRVTHHRVGYDDTQKWWVWPRDLYFWELGCISI